MTVADGQNAHRITISLGVQALVFLDHIQPRLAHAHARRLRAARARSCCCLLRACGLVCRAAASSACAARQINGVASKNQIRIANLRIGRQKRLKRNAIARGNGRKRIALLD